MTQAVNRSAPQTEDSRLARWRTLPRLLHLLWMLGPREVSLLLGFSLVNGLAPVARVIALRHLIDGVIAVGLHRALMIATLGWLAALLGANLLGSLLDLGRDALSEGCQERLKIGAQERLLVKAGLLPLAAFEQPDFYDRLQRAQQGLDARLFATMNDLFPIPSALVTAGGLMLYVASAGLLFPALLLGGLIPTYIMGRRFALRRYRMLRSHTSKQRVMDYLGRLMTGRDAAAEVRLFGLQSYLFERRRKLFYQLRDERLELAKDQAVGFTLPTVGEQLTYGLVIVAVVSLIARGRLSVGSYASYLDAAERFRDAFALSLYGLLRVDENLRYIRDLFDYLDIPEEAAAPPSAVAAPAVAVKEAERPQPEKERKSEAGAPTVRFEAVDFAYPDAERRVLQAATLTLRPAERIALVGRNGAGKTTLARLLLGLYRPTGGRITADGVDLQEIDPTVWRRRAAAVFQEYVRYQLSVRENIGFGALERMEDQEAICAAAARSSADAVIERLPAGYETILGKDREGGQDLSVGQWQKLAIARACLREAPILVLDEPTAALDARAEVEVYRQFREMAEGKTVVFISHRLGSARLADRILFLEGGRIIEEGSHDELTARPSRYAEMVAIQSKWYR